MTLKYKDMKIETIEEIILQNIDDIIEVSKTTLVRYPLLKTIVDEVITRIRIKCSLK